MYDVARLTGGLYAPVQTQFIQSLSSWLNNAGMLRRGSNHQLQEILYGVNFSPLQMYL